MHSDDTRISARKRPARRAGGFTLIELMIAIAVLAVIVGIAIPSYTQYVLKAGRSDAKGVLMQAAQTMERCYTRFSAYNDAACNLQQGDTVDSESDKYELTVTAVGANTFSLTAAPQGGQKKDTKCGDFTLDHTGARGISASSDPAVVEKCW